MLKINSDIEIKFLGSNKMEAACGKKSIFPIEKIGYMGWLDVIWHFKTIKHYFNICLKSIEQFNPDILITIDAPSFSCRIAKNIADHILKVQYVSPTVWAWKKNRLFHFKKIFNHILLLFPFEAQFCEQAGIPFSVVGSPVFEQLPTDAAQKNKFFTKYNIVDHNKVFAIYFGSRINEINRNEKLLSQAINQLASKANNIIILPTLPKFKTLLEHKYAKDNKIIIIDDAVDKKVVFDITHLAIAVSGTISLELSYHNNIYCTLYKLSFLDYILAVNIFKIKYSNIINIINDRECIVEIVKNYNYKTLSETIQLLDSKEEARAKQLKCSQNAINNIRVHGTPSKKAATTILDLFSRWKETHS